MGLCGREWDHLQSARRLWVLILTLVVCTLCNGCDLPNSKGTYQIEVRQNGVYRLNTKTGEVVILRGDSIYSLTEMREIKSKKAPAADEISQIEVPPGVILQPVDFDPFAGDTSPIEKPQNGQINLTIEELEQVFKEAGQQD